MSTIAKLLFLPAVVVAFAVGVGIAASTGGGSPVQAAGTTGTVGTTTDGVTTTTGGVLDISGPCDEAEHRNDPRCARGAADRDDNSGPGSGGSGHDERDDDNSGPGSGDDDDDDRSGHGGGDDDDDDGGDR